MHLQDADVSITPPISSPEFWKRPERVAASTDPDTATAQTIRIMCGHVQRSAGDVGVREAALQAMHRFAPEDPNNIGGADDPRSLAGAAFWWCKHFIKFVHHEFIIRQRLGEAGHLQGLISPDVLVQMDSPEGDCAIFTECVCAFLRVFGIPYEMVTVAVNPNEPSIYSHVYCYAVMPDGSRLPLDASHGPYPGWQVPSSDVFRRQVWDASGNPVADRGSRFDGLGYYAIRGLGQDPSVDVSEGGTYVPPPPADMSFDPGFTTPDWWSAPGPAGSSSPWGSVFANLANQWTQIGGRVLAPQTTLVRGPNGQLMYSTPANANQPGALPSLGGSSSWLLIAGLGVGALVLFSAMGKGK